MEARDFPQATLARLIPGRTTKRQTESLLGIPWRTVTVGPADAQNPGPLVWEYRGKDSNGAYRVHIEFDHHDVVTLVARIPDDTGVAPARMVK